MTLLNIEYQLPYNDDGRDVALLGRNVDGTMIWSIEAGRETAGPTSGVDGLSADQLVQIGVRINAILDGRL